MKPVSQMEGRVTLKDIASRLGISKATVSRALLQRSRVAKETRESVMKVAEEMGYRPDPALRALSNLRWTQHPESRSSYRLALLSVNILAKPGGSDTPDAAHQSAIDRAGELGFQLDCFDVCDAKGLARLGDVLFHRGYDGVIFGVRCPVQDWRFPYDHFPCVAISYDHPSHRLHQVTSDWFSAVSLATKEVLSRGYRRPGYLHYQRGNPSIDQRTWAGMLAGQDACRQRFGEAVPIFEYATEAQLGKDFYEANRESFRIWRDRHQPDVIIDGGFLARWWLKDFGVSMPDEVGMLVLRRQTSKEGHGISAIDHNLMEQGRWAVDLLYNMIQTGNRGLPQKVIRITVGCEFYDGGTLKPVVE